MSRFLKKLLLLLIVISSLSAKEKNEEGYKYPLVICSMFKNETRFLKEWIEFHKLVGVSHFYLYNNRSSDNYQELLAPYIEKGEVTLINWDYAITHHRQNVEVQEAAFADGLKKCTGVAKWAAFIDIDEFLMPTEKESLLEVLSDFEDVPALVVNWVMFGTSNVRKIPDQQLMIESLTKRASFNHSMSKSYKSIVRPECVEKPWTAHAFIYKKNCPAKFIKKGKGLYAVNEAKEPIKKLSIDKPSFSKIRINHYWARDELFFETEKLDRLKKAHPNNNWGFLLNELNLEEDKTILRFAPKLRRLCL